MARGRKPDTPDLQVAKGSPGKRKVTARQAPPVAVGRVQPPKWLRRSRKAAEIWNDLAPRLGRLNLLSELDAIPLARYCRYIVEWIAADIAVQKEGTWFDAVGTNGEPTKKRHPAWQACQDLERMLRETEASFGMRPDARYKIMRDQSLAHGVLPLFDQHNASEQRPTSPQQAEQDPLGILAAFDSAPPGLVN